MFVKLDPEEGNKYLILDVNFKNIDNESRMIGGAAQNIVDLLAGDGVVAVGDAGFVEHGDSRSEVAMNI